MAYGIELNIGGNALQSIAEFGKMINGVRGDANKLNTTLQSVKFSEAFNKAKIESASTSMNGVSSVLSSIKAQIAGVFAVGGISAFSSKVVETLSEFERYEAVLTNTLGSNNVAKETMTQITDFAATTPFQVNELTNSFIKLANQGFAPNAEEMRKLGDLASSTGKGFDQLAEALIDAQVGEFERLKEFGVRASKIQGSDNILVSFKGQTKVINETAGEMRNYLLSLGDLKGVSGAMAAISQTMGGKISNLQDGVTSFALSVGEVFAPLIKSVLQNLTNTFSILSKWVKDNQDGIRAWTSDIVNLGKAVLISYGVFKVLTVATSIYNGVMFIASNATNLFSGAQALLNIVLSANPIGIVITALAALSGAVYFAWQKFEGFRGFVMGFWEVIKVFGKFLYDFAIAPLEALGEILIGVFTFDTNLIQKGMTDALNVLKNNVDNVMNAGTKLGAAFNQGWNNGVNDFRASIPKKDGVTPNASKSPKAAFTNPNLGIDKKSKDITGENRQVKNINIQIGSVGQGFTIITNKIEESETKVKELFTRWLVDAVNQVNYQ